jgi:hypothetical protein
MLASNDRSYINLSIMYEYLLRATEVYADAIDRLYEEREDIFQEDIRACAPRALARVGRRRTCPCW